MVTLAKIILLLLLHSILTPGFGQDLNQINWIDVQGKDPSQIDEFIQDRVNQEAERPLSFLKKRMKELNDNKLEKENKFNVKKDELNNKKNDYHDKKSLSESRLKDQRTLVSELETEVLDIQRKIEDSENSIKASQEIIANERALVEEGLTKVKYNEVLIARVENVQGSNLTSYTEAMKYEIAKVAVSSALGEKVINTSIVDNNVLEKERVDILRQGKVNEMLKEDKAVRDVGDVQEHDRYLYGLVDIYPFQEKDVSLGKDRRKNILVDVNVLSDNLDRSEIFLTAHPSIKQKLERHLKTSLNAKNANNNSVNKDINRLGENFTSIKKREGKKIDRQNGNLERLNSDLLRLNDDIIEENKLLDQYQEELRKNTEYFLTAMQYYNSHIFNESYISVEKKLGIMDENNESYESVYIELASKTYKNFRRNTETQYIKEQTTVQGDSYENIETSKKSSIVLNAIGIIGRNTDNLDGDEALSVYIAFDYGFEFEQDTDQTISGDIQTTSSKSQFSSFTKKERPLKPKNNLKVTSKPSGANVFVSGRKIGVTPLSTYFDPGTYNLVFKKDGYQPGMDLITIKESGLTRSKTSLKRTAVADKTGQQDNGPSLFSKKNMIMAGGGIAILGGALFLLNQDEEETQQTGSVSISINIP